jgi:hypothetical protein
MATSDSESETRKREHLLENANRARAELGLPPLAAQQVAHDRALADASGVRLWGLIDVCTTMRRGGHRLD